MNSKQSVIGARLQQGSYPVFSLSVVSAVEAILSCCLMGAWDESCCEIWETRLVAEETVEDIRDHIMVKSLKANGALAALTMMLKERGNGELTFTLQTFAANEV